jgi:hypothetical protein
MPGRFADFVPRQIPQTVMGRLLIRLAERRVIESLLDELTNRQPVAEHEKSCAVKFSFSLRSIPYSPAALWR